MTETWASMIIMDLIAHCLEVEEVFYWKTRWEDPLILWHRSHCTCLSCYLPDWLLESTQEKWRMKDRVDINWSFFTEKRETVDDHGRKVTSKKRLLYWLLCLRKFFFFLVSSPAFLFIPMVHSSPKKAANFVAQELLFLKEKNRIF